MKNTVFLLLLVFLACDKDKDASPADNSQIMQDCRDNSITDSLAILDHVLGSWSLIGYNCGFCSVPPLPSSEVVFNAGTGKLSYRETVSDSLEVVDFTWHLEKYLGNAEPNAAYKLITDPYHEALSFELFCDDHMFYDHSPWDGLLFLYERD